MGVGTQILTQDYPMTSRVPDGCSVCGASRRAMDGQPDGKEPIIDFGISIEFEGNLYICYSCIMEMMEALHKVVPDDRLERMIQSRRRDGRQIGALLDENTRHLQAAEANRRLVDTLREEIKALRAGKCV